MNRLLATLVVAGAAAAFAACADSGPTAPKTATAAGAAGDVVGMAAPAPTASCTYVLSNSGGYDFTVTWSGFGVNSIEISSTTGPSFQETLGHPLRSGTVTGTVQTEPFTALLTGPATGVRTLCIATT